MQCASGNMRWRNRKEQHKEKNNEKTRSALATQTAVKLEEYRLQGILDSYRSPVVAASGEDPSVCVVTVEFTAARGLNQIVIQASITV